MLTSATKRLILSFSGQKSRGSEVEPAAVYVLAEQNRGKGGGLLSRQPQETIAFIAKMGYPLWLFPRNNSVLVFDAVPWLWRLPPSAPDEACGVDQPVGPSRLHGDTIRRCLLYRTLRSCRVDRHPLRAGNVDHGLRGVRGELRSQPGGRVFEEGGHAVLGLKYGAGHRP